MNTFLGWPGGLELGIEKIIFFETVQKETKWSNRQRHEKKKLIED